MDTLDDSAEWPTAVWGLYHLAGEEGEISHFDMDHSCIIDGAGDPTTQSVQRERKSVFL